MYRLTASLIKLFYFTTSPTLVLNASRLRDHYFGNVKQKVLAKIKNQCNIGAVIGVFFSLKRLMQTSERPYHLLSTTISYTRISSRSIVEACLMIVDAAFQIIGEKIPSDHGYILYCALSHLIPSLHNADWLAIHPINGMKYGDGFVHLSKRTKLRLRLPIEKLSEVIHLAGKKATIRNGNLVGCFQIGVPEIHPIKPSSSLYSNCVVIKMSHIEKGKRLVSRDLFIEAVESRLKQLGIQGRVVVDSRLDSMNREIARRVIRIKDKIIVGYATQIYGLCPDDSIKLQEDGVGGRRRMGCGVFQPAFRESL